jgi:hypothetical protein
MERRKKTSERTRAKKVLRLPQDATSNREGKLKPPPVGINLDNVSDILAKSGRWAVGRSSPGNAPRPARQHHFRGSIPVYGIGSGALSGGNSNVMRIKAAVAGPVLSSLRRRRLTQLNRRRVCHARRGSRVRRQTPESAPRSPSRAAHRVTCECKTGWSQPLP